VATLRDHRSAPGELRRAGEYQQLAVRRLASASSAFRLAVLTRTGRETSAAFTREVRGASSLARLSAPQKHLPRWRIIRPSPMSRLRGYYAAAQRLTGVNWTYLAAINLVETRMGRIRGESPAGARGPMQFLPSTWASYGAGGDINNPRDAILAAARLLRANGAPEHMAAALYRYNPSEHYVQAIAQYARTLQRAPYIYRGYYHWRVLFRDVHGLYFLPNGYPRVRPVLLESH
jgi:soluble lytic murein transglycosylase-like protein